MMVRDWGALIGALALITIMLVFVGPDTAYGIRRAWRRHKRRKADRR